MSITKAKQFNKDQALAWFLYHMDMAQRGRFVAALPEAYNDLMGTEVVVVVRKSDVAPYLNDEAGVDVAPFCFTGKPKPTGTT